MKALVKVLTSLLAVPIFTSCSSISYYHQSVSGQLALFNAQKDFSTLLQSQDTPEGLKHRLESITRIRDFASDVVQLPDNDSYRSYADIGRRYIVWNVFATPALSLEPHQSCFLIIGCLSYRGYFDKHDAIAFMEKLKKQGFDVYLGGVTAYSTLGWFDDPVLNGMLERDDIQLARLIFHELAHQQLYVKDDTEFNEAFADAVALIGLDYWLDAHATPTQRARFENELAYEKQFTDLVLHYQEKLDQLFNSDLSEEQKLTQKSSIISDLRSKYAVLRSEWGEYDEYDNWFRQGLNNAKIAAVSTYQKLVPLFIAVYEATGKDISQFYAYIDKIGRCSPPHRRKLLHSPAGTVNC